MLLQIAAQAEEATLPTPAVDAPPALEAALEAVLPQSLDGSAATMASWISSISFAVGIFLIGWIVSKWLSGSVRKVLQARGVEPSLTGFLAALTQWSVLAATAVSALGKVGVETTSLIALLGAAGLAIGLALQGSLSNFAAGIMALVFRPFVVGHKITAAGHTGVVQEVGLFATTLSSPSNDTIIIPNGEVMGSSVINHTHVGTYRCDVDIGVAYGTDWKTVERVLLDAMGSLDVVLKDPAPSVAFAGFGASSVDLVARPYCMPEDVPSCEHQTRIAIYEALDAADIEIPFDQVVMHQAAS